MERKILKASAGTGKTYRLSLEYIASLLDGEKARDIVVMTFTKKATSEIKERIIEFLEHLYSKDEKGCEIADSIIKLYPEKFSEKKEIFEKTEKIYYDVVLNKDGLKIFTIDGLKNLIFKKAIAPMLNINSYEIIDDFQNRDYLKKCFERIFADKNDFNTLKKFLEANLERNMENYVDVIKNIIDERWKSFLIDKNIKIPYEISGKLSFYLDKSIEAIESIVEKKGKAGETIKNFIKKDYYPYLEKFSDDEKEQFIYDKWKMIIDDEIENKKKSGSTKKINVDDENETLSYMREKLLTELSKRIFNDTVIENEKEILSFLEKIYNIYDEMKFRERKFTHQDITNYTWQYMKEKKLNLIDENGITPYMKELIESGVSSIFIDEFQDTSIIQWKIFKRIIDSAEKVICVGDEKQSIYGWRGGEKNLFINLQKILKGQEESLDTSYRSCKKIVEFTNDFFEKYSSYAEGEEINWSFEKVQSSKKEDEGYIEIWKEEDDKNAVDKKTAEDEIVGIIKEKFNGNYKGIGILARNNNILNDMAEILSENRIPYFLETNLDIFSHRTIISVVELMRYFSTENRFYLAEFLRDDLILVDDVLLKEFLVFRGDIEDFKFSDERYSRIMEKIIKLKKEFSENPFKNIFLLPEIIEEFGVLERYQSESDIQNVYDFIEASKKFNNIKELLSEIDENRTASDYIQSSVEMRNAVALMTIHKSKGLEFDTVFYIHNETISKGDSGVQFNISMSEDYEIVKDSLIIDAKFEKILKNLEDRFDYAEDKKKKRVEEEINNIYVALTRPKNNLFIMIKNVFKNSLFGKIISENYLHENEAVYKNGEIKFSKNSENFGEEIFEEKNSKNFEKFQKIKIDFSEYRYNEKKLQENMEKLKEEELKFSTEREEKREAGTIVHFFLENLIKNSKEEMEEAFKKTVSKFGASFGRDNIEKVLNGRGVKKFLDENKILFSDEWDLIYPEYSIYSDRDKALFRLDRVMIKKSKEDEKGKVLVVDYKTGGFEESQLENYLYLVRQELLRINELENYEIEGRYLQIELLED